MRISTGTTKGIDPYTRATSDVYQDLFGEGSFIGKGIYDVELFSKALDNRFPENRILSHDLLEGCYARCGLLSDVRVVRSLSLRAIWPTSSAATAGYAGTGR
jgi:cyclic beta-1,2-glucan synthetase